MPLIRYAVHDFERALLSLDRLEVTRMLAKWSASRSAIQVLEELVAPALERIGAGWEEGRVALSQVYMSGRLCEELVETILPSANPARRNQPRMAIAVLEDQHQLGKRVVYSALQASGYRLLDFGHGMSTDELVSRSIAEDIDILLISVLMLPSALMVKDVTAKLRAWKPGVKVVVGGAPFRLDDQLWLEVGADAAGYNSGDAIAIISRLSEEAR